MDDYVVVSAGSVVRTGLKGEVLVEPLTDELDRRFATGTRTRLPATAPSSVAGDPVQQGRLVVRFEGVADRTTAESAARATS